MLNVMITINKSLDDTFHIFGENLSIIFKTVSYQIYVFGRIVT